MAGPLAAISTGVGIASGLKSLFGGGGGRGRGRGRYTPRQFSYTPDPNDPEIGLRRRRFLEEISRDRGRTVDELGRAGLLGSSAAFGVLGEQERRGLRGTEDIDADVFLKRRLEALDLFKDEENFERSLALGEQGQGFRERMLGLESLGDIGGFLGGAAERYLNDDSYGGFLKRKRNLPRNALFDASQYDGYEAPQLRGRYL